jgi:thiamine-phosphate pyrophosphorylase
VTGSPDPRNTILPRVHLVTNDQIVESDWFDRQVERLMAVGGSRIAFHLRAKRATGSRFWSLAERCSRLAEDSRARLIVNDRADLAVACAAFGVQLGQSSMGPAAARRVVSSHRQIGVSVHNLPEAVGAVEDGADFLLAGTLFESSSHPGRPVAGVDWLPGLVGLGKPVIGIGGIDIGRVRAVLEKGAHGVAVIGAVWQAADPAESLSRLLERVEEGVRADV